jgi:hypothetical protein
MIKRAKQNQRPSIPTSGSGVFFYKELSPRQLPLSPILGERIKVRGQFQIATGNLNEI